MNKTRSKLFNIYKKLRKHFGFLNWWPGETPFEVMIGAILTQNTSWKNVETALNNLKREELLSFQKLRKIGDESLAELIRPSGYYNQKTKKIKNYLRFMSEEFGGSIEKMGRVPLDQMRGNLLSVKGIGPETADSILLYALGKRIFVVDAYTRRIFSRIGLVKAGWNYENLQKFFMNNLPDSLKLYNDYHAQVVILGKEICRKKPKCPICPLSSLCRYAKNLLLMP